MQYLIQPSFIFYKPIYTLSLTNLSLSFLFCTEK
jgi:hypothetical protein